MLVLDLRGTASPYCDYTTLGFAEPDDVSAAVAVHARLIPAHRPAGYSMGGVLAIETGARGPEVAFVIEDSGYGSLGNVFRAGLRQAGPPPVPFGLPLLWPSWGSGERDRSDGVLQLRIRPLEPGDQLAPLGDRAVMAFVVRG